MLNGYDCDTDVKAMLRFMYSAILVQIRGDQVTRPKDFPDRTIPRRLHPQERLDGLGLALDK